MLGIQNQSLAELEYKAGSPDFQPHIISTEPFCKHFIIYKDPLTYQKL
jgi:hypothetical protein